MHGVYTAIRKGRFRMNKLLLEKMQHRLDQKGVKYYTKENIVNFNINIGEIIGSLKLAIHILDDSYVSYAYLNNKATQEHYCNIAEYLHRANYGLAFGNFEMDYLDGEIRYKYAVEISNPNNISNHILDKCVLLPCLMFERYGSGMMKLMLGVGTPEELISEAEGDSED